MLLEIQALVLLMLKSLVSSNVLFVFKKKLFGNVLAVYRHSFVFVFVFVCLTTQHLSDLSRIEHSRVITKAPPG